MTTIQVYAEIKGHEIQWLFDGEDESHAVRNAKNVLRQKGMHFKDYIIA